MPPLGDDPLCDPSQSFLKGGPGDPFSHGVYLSAIAAQDKNRVIGTGISIPWNIPQDTALFRATTVGKICIMGRRTYESLPGPLRDRHHIVVSRTLGALPNQSHVSVVSSLGSGVWSLCRELMHKGYAPEVMVIGGGTLYSQLLPVTRRIYLTTLLDHASKGWVKVRFPVLEDTDWDKISSRLVDGPLGRMTFDIYSRPLDLLV